jgi:hypothetical protein
MGGAAGAGFGDEHADVQTVAKSETPSIAIPRRTLLIQHHPQSDRSTSSNCYFTDLAAVGAGGGLLNNAASTAPAMALYP